MAPRGFSDWDWSTSSPDQGMSSRTLEAMKKALVAQNTSDLLVIRNDTIVLEWHAPGRSAGSQHYTASLAKAVVGGLSLAVAISDGRIALDDKAARFIPQWREDPRKSRITIRQLGSHTSGIEDAEAEQLPHDKLTGWKGDFWKRLDPPHDPFTVSRDLAPVLFEPGERLHYSNPGIAMLNYATTVALQQAPQQDIRTLLRDRVMRPIGVPDGEWSVGYGVTCVVDGFPLVGSWGGASYTARALARVGRLMIRQGNWEGRQLISREAVRQVTSDVGTPGNCGIGWWSNNERVYADVPRDAFWGSGAGHQVLFVVPSLNLIAVRNGDALAKVGGAPLDYHEPLRALLFEPVVEAVEARRGDVRSDAPYPRSPVIELIEWAPKETILRLAQGSDNWPLTWGNDDALYTAYGDGNGFEPFVPRKLGLGFAKVLGAPPNFSGVNIRSSSGEQIGDGPRSRKASGILMLHGQLFLWARNAGNSQLARSADQGKSWLWSNWRFTNSFGCPTFLNYGRDYAGARDEFVYVYSPDDDSAYRGSDSVVLARAPKEGNQVWHRQSYEFFQGLDSQGRAIWTKDFAQRGAVFRNPGRCLRPSVSYNPALKRYLLVMPLATSATGDARASVDTRFRGGLGIYDAPEPWGPWTTVFFTEQWDVGPGDTASFPTKWMSADGKTCFLVFSGEDSFSVRRATLRASAPIVPRS